MAQGNVAALEAALRDHQAASPASELEPPVRSVPVSAPSASPRPARPVTKASKAHPPISIADTLANLGDGLDDARLAWISGEIAAVRTWVEEARPLLEAVLAQLAREAAEENPQLPLLPDAPTDPGPGPELAPPVRHQKSQGMSAVGPVVPVTPAAAATILMPKVRHSMALIVEGMGDPDQGPALAEALGVDGVTARLIAVSRYPRFVFRGEDEVRMTQAAARVREVLGVRAAVVTRDKLLSIGPAVAVTQAITADPLRLEIVDRAMWDVDLRAQPGKDPREIVPTIRLAVVGEIVVHRFRALPQGGRLKHIRENRVQGAGEERLAVVDLHTDGGILRVVEGATDLNGFPGHTPSSAVRSLREFVAHLHVQIPVMTRRVCQPGLDRPGGGAVAGQAGTSQDTGWGAFEEHSRACRLLFGLPIPQ